MTTFKEVKNEWLKDPLLLAMDMSRSTGTKIPSEPLRRLFNHAGKPVPSDLQQTKEEYFNVSRGTLASLVNKCARNNGCGRPHGAVLWLRTRLG